MTGKIFLVIGPPLQRPLLHFPPRCRCYNNPS